MLGDQHKRLLAQVERQYVLLQKARSDPTVGSKVEMDVKTMWLLFGDLVSYLTALQSKAEHIPIVTAAAPIKVEQLVKEPDASQAYYLNQIENLQHKRDVNRRKRLYRGNL